MSEFINYIKEKYSKDDVLLEIGAGYNSTKELSCFFRKMYSVENNLKFCDLYSSNYIHVDLDKDGWYKKDIFKQKLPNDYNLILLDGPLGGFDPPFIKNESRIFRLGFVRHNWDCIKKDVDIIIDDTDRDWLERDVVKFLKNKGYRCKDKGSFHICSPQ